MITVGSKVWKSGGAWETEKLVTLKDEFEVELAEGEVIWFFADSNGGWTSAALAVFADVK